MAKDLEYYLAQARRIQEHREKGAEREIRKIYKTMLKDLQGFMSETYVQYAKDDKLTYGMLQEHGYAARFLEEVEQRLNISTPAAAKRLRELVEETYDAAYTEMVKGVARGGGLEAAFFDSVAITPDQIKSAVENPVSGLTLSDVLEKNRKEIVYNIKRTVGVGLMNGDRYTTMAKRIAEHVDGDYKKAIRIARTETHRVREAGNVDAAKKCDVELQGGTSGFRMVKTWKSMKDERVRPQRVRRTKKGWSHSMGNGPANHMKMEGQIRLADELFDLGGGVTADAPGNSGDAGNDINCRCYASYEMMDDATYFAKTGKHFPGWKEAQSGIQREPYTELRTMTEVRDYATRYSRSVNYGYDEGDVEFFNVVNDSLTTLEQRYPTGRLKKIYVNDRLRTSSMRANCDELEISLKTVRGDRYTMEMWEADKARMADHIEPYRSWGDEREARRLEERIRYGRWCVSSSYKLDEDYLFSEIAHEYGHILADQYIGMINGGYGIRNGQRLRQIGSGSPVSIAKTMVDKVSAVFRKAKRNGDIYNISCYAATNKDEFFSEVFSMYACGEKLPDYIKEMVEEVLRIGKLQ